MIAFVKIWVTTKYAIKKSYLHMWRVKMAKLTFKGGIHPYDGKDLSKNKPIVDADPTEIMVYPLSQHIGAPAKPIVSVGERVLGNQKIAEAGGFVSANIHASVSGVVKAIEPRRVVGGSKQMCIVIENDNLYEMAPPMPVNHVAAMTREEVIDLIKEAGIIGMGGAGFPTHVKLMPKNPDDIHYIIANCAECEPYLTSDYRRMIEEPNKLVDGLKIMLSLFPNARGILAVEDNKPDAIKILREITIDETRIDVKALKTKYPQGSERQLIYATTGRAINSSMLPADAGCIVDNVDTIVAIYHAVIEGLPLTERIVTVTGDAIRFPQNYRVKCGTLYSSLIEASGGFKDTYPEKIVSGGPMMGRALFELDVPTTKASSALLCLKKDDVKACKPTNCINCGMCVQVCPSRLIPSRLADFAEHGDKEKYESYNGLECVECGSCSFICPAKRQLVQSIGTMRKQILADKRNKK